MGNVGGRVTSSRAAPICSFAGAARRYWLDVHPPLKRERRARLVRAGRIRDPQLREAAIAALAKWGNVEGAAAFAAFTPRRARFAAARAMACFQAAYNYLDMLAEQPGARAAEHAQRLHEALIVALDPTVAKSYHYAGTGQSDGGYLDEMVEECRGAVAQLAGWSAVLPAALRVASRIVAFQGAKTGDPQGDLVALRGVVEGNGSRAQELGWWEMAAAYGSSLEIYALMACAALPVTEPAQVSAIEGAYFPWIGALHSLLDNLVDIEEDRMTGQHSLIGCYASATEAMTRMEMLAQRSRLGAEEIAGAVDHALVLAAMASFYLSRREAREPRVRSITESVLGALGPYVPMSMVVFRVRRAVGAQPW
jgi:tetraprenyl-beta-curcumene synthase